jgi:hypothetical protein
MFFQTIFVSLVAILFGLAVCFAGFRLFVLLLPIWGFFAGFLVTAQAIQELFGGGFLATTSGWVFGLVVGVLFAVAAYFFYYAAIVVLGVTVGYELGIGIMAGLGVSSGFFQFIVGVVVAAALTIAVVLLDLPKAFIVALTALAGASMVLSGILLALGRIPLTYLHDGLVGAFIRSSWLWFLVYLVIAAVGMVAQFRIPLGYSLAPYGRQHGSLQAMSATSAATPQPPQQPTTATAPTTTGPGLPAV